MTQEITKPADEQNGTDGNRDPITGTPVGTGQLVAGPEAHSLAEKMDPEVEDAYWKANYSKRKYVESNVPFTMYQSAYRTGYEGHSRYPGKKFEEVETNLQHDYDQSKGNSTLSWDQARNATRDAWNRVEQVRSGNADGDGR